ncbi:MAG: DNA replication/repair protein RecF [Shimia sp.]
MLTVSSLVLSHFRSHRVSRLTLDGRPVVLFGPNGAGKTNVLEAVSLLSPGRGLRRAQAAEISRRPEGLGWKVRADLSLAGAGHEVETWADPGAPRSVRIDGKVATQAVLGDLVRCVWLVPAMDRLWIEGAEGRRRFLDRLALSFFPAHAEAALDYEKAMRERNRLLRDDVRDAGWFGALEARMDAAGRVMTAHRLEAIERLQAAQEEGAGPFPVAALSLTHADGPLPDDLGAALAAGRARDRAAGRTLVGPHRADLEAVYAAKGVPARDCSTGEQKALLVSLILANARALIAEAGHAPLVLLDEVTAHLDAGRQAALWDALEAVGAQAWMTGTGAEPFRAMGARAQRFEVTEAEDGSTIVPVEG